MLIGVVAESCVGNILALGIDEARILVLICGYHYFAIVYLNAINVLASVSSCVREKQEVLLQVLMLELETRRIG